MTDPSLDHLVATLWPGFTPTPLRSAPVIAARLGLAGLYMKMETDRPLGNFKSLGGMTAGILALMQHSGCQTLDALASCHDLPALVCASDGNHGLAVAAAAKRVNARATIFLPRHVSGDRVDRIARQGARIERVAGTYDDAVDLAQRFAAETGALLVPDTSNLAKDPVVQRVMEGYGIMTSEIVEQLSHLDDGLTHVFVQAGVGGLAAALAKGLAPIMTGPNRIVIVEPEAADCVGQALRHGHLLRLTGTLETTADMLSCGEASASAVKELLRHKVAAIALTEAELAIGPDLAATERAATTISGAAGLAGLAKTAGDPDLRTRLQLTEASRVLVVLTEAAVATGSS